MESRRVTLTLEVETDAPLEALGRAKQYNLEVLSAGAAYEVEVVQAEANVIQGKMAARPKRARKAKPRKK